MNPTQTTLRLFEDEIPESAEQAAAHPLEPSRFGGIKLHDLARNPHFVWDLVDQTILTETVLLSVDGSGLSVAHLLARKRFIDRLPPALLTPRLLMARGGHVDYTVLHEIAWNRCWYSVNKAVQALISEEMLLAPDGNGWTVAHLLARQEGFGKLPPNLITPRVLMARAGRSNDTVLHFLATTSFVGALPGLTPEMLMAVNSSNRTVLESAARNLKISEVAGLLNTEMLAMKTSARRTILSYAVQEKCLDLIPPSAFRPEWMRRKFKGRSLLQILTQDYADYTSAHFSEFDEKIGSALLARLFAA